ncbi:hypothetical protein KQX63_15200 [Rhodopseudomonas palustris]|uniref:hypothetical protein n=1 Tax=Rhodopseudomonas palustris TaxID=1076 RepID=UPI0021F3BB2D|nr:hypothetical protein [Rhodopseudomonas palustris]UYO42747.1 hypothetical protein KQX63_15200 [Rhodopseudomonas palustris]
MKMKTLEDLLPKLIKSTEDKKLTWIVSSTGFECHIGNQDVKTWAWFDEGSETNFVTVQLRAGPDFNPTILDSVTAGDFESNYNIVSSLHSAARRSAHNVDAIIENISDKLDKL